ncbi:MAG: class IV adenylate cyclase [Bacteroidetes bacterium]|nr:class IV adenylate cyclase [Bacteroidota bacterium]
MNDSKNIEIKARCIDLERIRKILLDKKAEFIGVDHQVDTYFKVNSGRLKLREGNIENNLIHYQRPDQLGPKQSDFTLFKTESGCELKKILNKALGIMVIVDKIREIYFIDNVKFHLDQVKDLGSFIEIEVIDKQGVLNENDMLMTCQFYLKLFLIKKNQLIENSYSDMILKM